MGQLIDGEWHHDGAAIKTKSGRFIRKDAAFRNWVTAEGAAGPSGKGGFKAEPGRYHLIVSLACPWAHRTLIFRTLKKLDDLITVSGVEPLAYENGWTFAEPEPVTGARYAWEVYTRADPAYTGRATVPILWDKKQDTIVSNESSEIIRMFNSAFNAHTDVADDYYPADLRQDIDAINARVYDTVNNGVYRAGFATSSDAYEEAAVEIFRTLDMLEERLSTQRYLVGNRMTEADWRLFTTLVRFDAVYVGHFKCNLRRIEDYPNLSNYLRDLYQVPGVAGTVDIKNIKTHYYGSHESINPHGIVPIGPALDFDRPHNREALKAA